MVSASNLHSLSQISALYANDEKGLPPKGDMSDKEYMLMLMRMREEAAERAAGADAERGSALHPTTNP